MADGAYKEIKEALIRIEDKLGNHGESLSAIDEHLKSLNGTVKSNCDDLKAMNEVQTRWKGVTIGIIITLTIIIPSLIALYTLKP